MFSLNILWFLILLSNFILITASVTERISMVGKRAAGGRKIYKISYNTIIKLVKFTPTHTSGGGHGPTVTHAIIESLLPKKVNDKRTL